MWQFPPWHLVLTIPLLRGAPVIVTMTLPLWGRVDRDIPLSVVWARFPRRPPHLSFDVRSQEIASDEDDAYSQAAWKADREVHLLGKPIV